MYGQRVNKCIIERLKLNQGFGSGTFYQVKGEHKEGGGVDGAGG